MKNFAERSIFLSKPARAGLLLFFLSGHMPMAKAQEGSTIHHSELETDGKHHHGAHPECPLPKSPLDVVRCAQKENPTVKRARLATGQSLGLTSVARQIPNPDVDLQSGFAKPNDETRSEVQIGIRQPIEWGGKRSSRIRLAEAEQKQVLATESEVEAEIVAETVLKLHRLRQIEQERKAIESTIAALTNVIKQQQSRAALAPEQQGALSIYRMALADARIRASEVFEEERAVEHYFHVSTGHSLAELSKVLPPEPKDWPSLEDVPKTQAVSPGITRALADREFALAQMDLASAASWPNLSVGPQITFERDGPRSNTLFGVALVMDLPLFQMNGAGRAYAASGLTRYQSLIALTKAEESHERAEQLRVYRNALEVLKDSPTIVQIEHEHSKNEGLGKRGLISGSLLVESYRQRNDLIRGRNGRELKALQALWLVYKFDGRIFEEPI